MRRRGGEGRWFFAPAYLYRKRVAALSSKQSVKGGLPSFEAVHRAGESAKTFQALFSHAAERAGASPLERPRSRPPNNLKTVEGAAAECPLAYIQSYYCEQPILAHFYVFNF